MNSEALFMPLRFWILEAVSLTQARLAFNPGQFCVSICFREYIYPLCLLPLLFTNQACLHCYYALSTLFFCRASLYSCSGRFRGLAAELHHTYPACRLCVKSPGQGNDEHCLDMICRPLTLHLDGLASHGICPEGLQKGVGDT